MPSQLVKCAFGFRSFNAPKTKFVSLSVELGSEQEGHVPPVPPYVTGPAEILKATLVSFIVSYFSFIGQTNYSE